MRFAKFLAALIGLLLIAPSGSIAQTPGLPKAFVPSICDGATSTLAAVCVNDGNGAKLPIIQFNPKTHGLVSIPQAPLGNSGSVTNTAALKAIVQTIMPNTMVRQGFSAPGDGPSIAYTYSGAACSAADDGAQITAGDGKCWLAVLPPLVDPRIWGAKCDGLTDDTAAITAALKVASVIIPDAACRTASTITVPPGRTLTGSTYIPAEPPAGSRILCDLGVSPCVQTGITYSGSSTIGGQNVHHLSIVRAAGTIPDGSICFLNLSTKVNVDHIDCNGHYDAFVFRASGIYGHVNHADHLIACNTTGTDLTMDSLAELHADANRFGCNGTRQTKHGGFVKFTGGGSGPSTAWITNTQFNDAYNPTCAFSWVGNTGNNFNEYRIAYNHLEITGTSTPNPHYVFCADSTVPSIANLDFSHNTVLDNNGNSIAFNPAFSSTTVFGDSRFANNYWTGFGNTGWTLAPKAAFTLNITGDIFNGPRVVVTGPGVGQSLFNMTGFTSYSGVTIGGSFGDFPPKISGVAENVNNAAAVTNTATSPVEIDVPQSTLTDNASSVGLSFGGTAATLSATKGKWVLRGSQITWDFSFTIGSMNGGTGSPLLTGLPFGGQPTPSSFAPLNCTGVKALVSPVYAQVNAGTKTLNLAQSSTYGVSAMSEANFAAGASCAGEVTYSIQ